MQNMLKQNGWILALLVLLFPGLSGADDSLLPDIPLQTNGVFSETQGCVEPTEEMRRNHMEYILHQRDETMYRGIRTTQYSLEECINCHVSEAPDAPRINSDQHFCNSCHTYAAVSIDCFQCHSDRPDTDDTDTETDSRLPDGLPHRTALEERIATEETTHD
jgi:hypothetical protein